MPSDAFRNLLRYYEVPPYSLPYTLSEAHITREERISRGLFDVPSYYEVISCEGGIFDSIIILNVGYELLAKKTLFSLFG